MFVQLAIRLKILEDMEQNSLFRFKKSTVIVYVFDGLITDFYIYDVSCD